jgi:hypothetical protein
MHTNNPHQPVRINCNALMKFKSENITHTRITAEASTSCVHEYMQLPLRPNTSCRNVISST